MPESPRDRLRSWLPHGLLLGLAVLSVWWLLQVVAPIQGALLLGAALAILTHPVLFHPVDRLFARGLPSWSPEQRHYLSAMVATLALAGILTAAVLVVLWAVIGDVHDTLRAAIGLAFQDPRQIDFVIGEVSQRTAALLQLYPSLGLTQADVRAALQDFLAHNRFGPEFVKLLFTGTGGLIVEVMLTLTTLFYLHSQGAMLARFLLTYLPLSASQQVALRVRFHRTVQHMLAHTLGKAVVIGLCLGALAWAIAGFNFVLVAVVGMFVGLMPVVGHAFVWLPLASLLASQGHWLDASCLSLASLSAAWLIDRAAYRMALAMGTDEVWLSFLLFLSVVGGALGYGPRGLIIGPAAVIMVTVFGEFLASLYGRNPPPPEESA
jgi:predicted PurR-regulated permease PerM